MRDRGRAQQPAPGLAGGEEIDLIGGADGRTGIDGPFQEETAGTGVAERLHRLQDRGAPGSSAAVWTARTARVDNGTVGGMVGIEEIAVRQVQRDHVAVNLCADLAVIRERRQHAGNWVFLVVAAGRSAVRQVQLDNSRAADRDMGNLEVEEAPWQGGGGLRRVAHLHMLERVAGRDQRGEGAGGGYRDCGDFRLRHVRDAVLIAVAVVGAQILQAERDALAI